MKKSTVHQAKQEPLVSEKCEWKDVTDYSQVNTSQKVAVELSLDELHYLIVGLWATARDLSRKEHPKSFAKHAQRYAALCDKLDKIHDEHSQPKAYVMTYAYQPKE